jgi:protoheme ferro-lyase
VSDAVVLMAYGSPATAEDVRPYLEDIRRGRPVSDEAVAELAERYRRIGGRSPLDEVTGRSGRRPSAARDPGLRRDEALAPADRRAVPSPAAPRG